MSIIRVHKTRDYSVIANAGLRDRRLSFAARGVLAYLLTKPDDWTVKSDDLVEQSPAGRDAIQGYLRELETYGYLVRERRRGEGGRYQWFTEVYESPVEPKRDFPAKVEPAKDFPARAEPAKVEPAKVEPARENPAIKEIRNKEELNSSFISGDEILNDAFQNDGRPITEALRQQREGVSDWKPSPSQPTRGPLFEALAAVCRVNYYRLRDRERMKFDNALIILQRDEKTPDDVYAFGKSWLTFWRCTQGGNRPPTPKEVAEIFDQVVNQKELDRAVAEANANSGNGNGNASARGNYQGVTNGKGNENAERIREAAELLRS